MRSPRLRLVGFLATLVLAAGCGGGEGEGEGEGEEPSSSSERKSPGTAASFRKDVGALCPPFYEKAGALQLRLRLLRITDRSSPQEKRKGLATVGQIQKLSRRFAADQGEVALPAKGPARRDAKELVESTRGFVETQNRNLDYIGRLASKGGTDSDRQNLLGIRQELGTRLQRQQQLVQRLKITKCLPPG